MEAVLAIRNAFEHIDERAIGKAHRENPKDAMSVFHQSEFFTSGVLRYAGHALDIRGEAVPALIAGRRFIVEACHASGFQEDDQRADRMDVYRRMTDLRRAPLTSGVTRALRAFNRLQPRVQFKSGFLS